MRIRRLDLIAYGHFSDEGFDLPKAEPDIHFIYGVNEAGKSTALSGIEDLLFGVPANSPHGFLHGYGNMRIGADLEGSGNALEFVRRKGNKDTLLDKSGTPLPASEAALTPFLNGAERAFYARMFCLDHARFRQGGREILEAQDDVGQILFSAGAGITGLREHLRKLHADADALWAKRRASHRKYFQAEDRLDEAEKGMREHTVLAARWHELRTALDQAKEACAALEADIETRATEGRKLARIRRVYRNVQRHVDAGSRIADMGAVVPLPEDASQQLQDALSADTQAEIRLTTLTEQIEGLRAEGSALSYDEGLLARGDDIRTLNEHRIQVRAEKADLPKRRAELAAAESDLQRLAAELAWQAENSGDIADRIPPRPELVHARALSKRHGELVASEANARAASEDADELVSALAQEIGDEGEAADLSSLAAAITVAREAGDIPARVAAAEKEAADAEHAIRKLYKGMRPSLGAGVELGSLPVPQKEAVERHRDRGRETAQRLQDCRDQIRHAELALKRSQEAFERVTDTEHAVPLDELTRLRQRRDAGWSIIRRKYIENISVPESEIEAFDASGSVADAYELATCNADQVADQRYEKAEATARLAEIARQIADQEEQLEELRGQEHGYCGDEEALTAQWLALWRDIPLEPLAADDMLAWLDIREQILQALESKAIAERETAFLRDEESRVKALLMDELSPFEIEPKTLSEKPLRVVVELAADIQRQHIAKADARRKLEDALKKATSDAARKRKGLQESEQSLSGWREQWSEAIAALGLDAKATVETLETQIDVIERMRDMAGHIAKLKRERIEKIERDIARFEKEASEIVAAIYPQLAENNADSAALELERLLKEATQAQETAAQIDARITAEQKKADECEQARRESKEAIARLQALAGVTSTEELRIAIHRSDESRTLRSEMQIVATTLSQDGDGLSLSELAAECKGADIDQVTAREETVNRELADLRNRQLEATETRSVARRAFEAVGGDDRAARAAADRQAALAEMKAIAEEYMRLRSAELLLQWAIERYRREKQAPLLKRAGELFAILTGGSFVDLQLDFDDSDKAQLAGVRQDGNKVTVSGMSTGSADQLYLALRVAAVEDFLEHAPSLPFIADDLFINFDDERASAGIKVLAQLAKRTQVLFFTHHQHLLDIARAAIGVNVSIISLPSRTVPSTAGTAPLATA